MVKTFNILTFKKRYEGPEINLNVKMKNDGSKMVLCGTIYDYDIEKKLARQKTIKLKMIGKFKIVLTYFHVK